MNIYFMPFLMSVIQCSVTKRKFGNNTITTVNTHTEHFLEDKINENLPLIDHDDFVQTSFSEFIPKVSKKGKYENTSQWFQGSLSNLNDNCLPVLSEEEFDKCFLDTSNYENTNVLHDNTQPIIFEHENLPRKETLSSITQKTANDVVLENDPEISSAYLFSNKNTKYETFFKTNDNIEPLDTLKIYKQPLNLENNIPEEICLWGNNEKTLKSFIDEYISDNILTFYNTNDLRKIRNIEEAFKIFDKNKNALKTNYLFFEHPNKETIVCELNSICSALDKCQEFTKNTLDVFLMKFDLRIFYSLYFKDLQKKLARLSDEKSILVFYCEIFKLYKYVVDIPELLTLGGLFSKRSFPNVALVIHLINLFFERNNNAKEKKAFVVCMISKVLFCFYGYSFDIFLVSHYKFKCIESCHDLNYFIWEFNKHKRKDPKIRIFRNSEYISSERKYFKSVLLIYLYNHLLFCRYCNIGSESIKLVQDFIEKVIKSEGCIGCLLNEFLRVIQLCCNEKI